MKGYWLGIYILPDVHDPVFSTKLFYFDLVIVFVAYTDSYQTIWEKMQSYVSLIVKISFWS